jgi:hypothetical protein
VIELNRKLGYRTVRSGPLWDEVPRASLVKWLKSAVLNIKEIKAARELGEDLN